MKKFIIFSGILALFLFISCIGQDSPEKIYGDFVKATDTLVKDLEQADDKNDSEGIAKALKKYKVKVQKLVPRIKRVSKEYREHPEKFEASMDKVFEEFKAALSKIGQAITKLVKYLTSKEVQDAIKEVQKEIEPLFKN